MCREPSESNQTRSELIDADVGRESSLLAHVLFEKPLSRNQIKSSAIKKLLRLAFRLGENLEELSARTARETMFLANGEEFALHILGDPTIGGLAMFVHPVIYQQVRNMTDSAAVLTKAQDKIDVATVQKFLMTISAKALVNILPSRITSDE